MYVEPRTVGRGLAVLVAAAAHDVGIAAGEILGVTCRRCGACGASADRLRHDPGCALEREGVDATGLATPGAALRPDTRFTILRWARTDRHWLIYRDDPVGFRCDGCGSVHAGVFGMAHDAGCPLSDGCDPGRTDGELLRSTRARADGGG